MIAVGLLSVTLSKVLRLQRAIDVTGGASGNSFVVALRQLDRIFKRRTQLSGKLLDVIAGHRSSQDYSSHVDAFLSGLVDDTEVLFSELTHSKCVVTIKLLVETSNSGSSSPAVITAFRDRDSQEARGDIYDDFEPFEITGHSFIRELLTDDPFKTFVASDNLRGLGHAYENPNDHWSTLFNSSAVHAIVSPGVRSSDSVYGFLCVDNRHGGLASEHVQPLMSIVSTAVFYVLSAASMLDEMSGANSQ